MNPRTIFLLRIGVWITFVIGLAAFLGGLSLLYLDWIGWTQ